LGLAFSAFGQSRQTVTTDANGVVIAPSNFWEANVPPAQEYPYPVFRLEPPYGAPWTDFEIKASRDNFQTLEYYFHSPAPLVGEVGEVPVVYFSESGTAREWRMVVDEPTGNFIVSGAGKYDGIYTPVSNYYVKQGSTTGERLSPNYPTVVEDVFVWYFNDVDAIIIEALPVGPHPPTPDLATWPSPIAVTAEGGRTSIAQLLTDNNSEVGGIVVVITDPAVINSMNDTELVWSYTWFDASTSEKDNAGRQIWRSILPVQWVTEPTQP
jgi:hypothetical protein